MRVSLVSVLCLALGALAAAPSLAATGKHYTLAKPGSELKLCGSKPTAPGAWHCVGQSEGAPSAGGGEKVSLTYQKITWSWVQGGKTMSDSWDAK